MKIKEESIKSISFEEKKIVQLFHKECQAITQIKFDSQEPTPPILKIPYFKGVSAITHLAAQEHPIVMKIIRHFQPLIKPLEKKTRYLKSHTCHKPILFYQFSNIHQEAFLDYSWVYPEGETAGQICLEQSASYYQQLKKSGYHAAQQDGNKTQYLKFESLLQAHLLEIFSPKFFPFLAFYAQLVNDAVCGFAEFYATDGVILYNDEQVNLLIQHYGASPVLALQGFVLAFQSGFYENFELVERLIHKSFEFLTNASFEQLQPILVGLARNGVSLDEIQNLLKFCQPALEHIYIKKALFDLAEAYALENKKQAIQDCIGYYLHVMEEGTDHSLKKAFRFSQENLPKLYHRIMEGYIKGAHYENMVPYMIKYGISGHTVLAYLSDPAYLHFADAETIQDIIKAMQSTFSTDSQIKVNPSIAFVLDTLNQQVKKINHHEPSLLSRSKDHLFFKNFDDELESIEEDILSSAYSSPLFTIQEIIKPKKNYHALFNQKPSLEQASYLTPPPQKHVYHFEDYVEENYWENECERWK